MMEEEENDPTIYDLENLGCFLEVIDDDFFLKEWKGFQSHTPLSIST